MLRTTLLKTLATSVILAPRGTKVKTIAKLTRNQIIEGLHTHRETTMTKSATLATILAKLLSHEDVINRTLIQGNAIH